MHREMGRFSRHLFRRILYSYYLIQTYETFARYCRKEDTKGGIKYYFCNYICLK